MVNTLVKNRTFDSSLKVMCMDWLICPKRKSDTIAIGNQLRIAEDTIHSKIVLKHVNNTVCPQKVPWCLIPIRYRSVQWRGRARVYSILIFIVLCLSNRRKI